MRPSLTATLKVLIAALILMLLAAQIVAIPAIAASMAGQYPEFAGLQYPALALSIALILCVQLTFACVWKLLSLVRRDTIFSRAAFRYVDAILVLIVIATIIAVAAVIMLVAAKAGPGSLLLLGCFGVVIGAGLALLVLVMRGLLEKALRLEQDLSEVV